MKLKEVPQILDRLLIRGGGRMPRFRGIRMPDGSPVPVELIMQAFGVGREEAERIQERQTR